MVGSCFVLLVDVYKHQQITSALASELESWLDALPTKQTHDTPQRGQLVHDTYAALCLI